MIKLLMMCYTACITILPSDDPYGVFSFEGPSLTATISEPRGAPSTANGKLAEYLMCRCIETSRVTLYH